MQKNLLAVREYRSPPARDDKIITSWNGMMLQGLIDAYQALGEVHFLKAALP